MEDPGRTSFLAVVAAAVVLLFLRIGAPPLIDPDEARFARTSVEMTRTGDPVVPTFAGRPRIVKPPLFHWLQAGLFRVLGPSEWVARLPSGLATLGSVLLVGWIARRRFGEEGAAWAAAVFITMPLVLVEGRTGTLEALLAVHILAVVALDVAEPGEVGPARGAAVGALLGLAFLVKGPIGVVLPLVMMLAGRTMAARDVVPAARTVAAFVGGWSVVALPWTIAFVQRLGVETAVATVRSEALDRYFAGTVDVRPPWYYLPVLVAGVFPWLVPMVLGMGRVLGRRGDPAARTALYCGAALLAGLLFLSVGRGKLAHYVLPLAPLAAVIVTWELGQELDSPGERRFGPLCLAGSLLVFGMFLGAWAATGLEEAPRTTATIGALAYLAAGLAAIGGVVRRRPRAVFGAAAAASAVFLVAASAVLHPWLGDDRSARRLVATVAAIRSPRPLVVVSIRVPSLVYYSERIPERIGSAELSRRIDREDAPLFVLADVDLPSVPPGVRARLREIGRAGKLRVFEEIDPAVPDAKGKRKPRQSELARGRGWVHP